MVFVPIDILANMYSENVLFLYKDYWAICKNTEDYSKDKKKEM